MMKCCLRFNIRTKGRTEQKDGLGRWGHSFIPESRLPSGLRTAVIITIFPGQKPVRDVAISTREGSTMRGESAPLGSCAFSPTPMLHP